MQTTKTLNIQAFFNKHNMTKFQWMIFVMMFLVAFFDGYDTAAIAYIAPHLLNDWGLQRADLIPVLNAALFGLAIGAVSFGPVADKYGRKNVVNVAVAVFAISTIFSAFSQTLFEMEVLRFIAGIGLGAAMPNAVTLFAEFCPEKNRAMLVNMMFCGFPLGSAIGGFLAAWLIPNFGWHSTLLFGGIAPAILLVIMIIFLPESVRFQISTNKPAAQIQKTLIKIHPEAANYQQFIMLEANAPSDKQKFGLSVILSKHYALGSVLLWACYFFGLIIVYGIINWMPTLLAAMKGMGPIVTGLFQLGGLGAIVSGMLMRKYNGYKLIAFINVLTAIGVALIGHAYGMSVTALVIVTMFAGLMMNTAQSTLPVLAAAFYPTQGRTTGVSWMLGVGRLGALVGTALVGYLIKLNFSMVAIFHILALSAALTALCLMVIYTRYRKEIDFSAGQNTAQNH